MENQKRTVRRIFFVLWIVSIIALLLLRWFILPAFDGSLVSANLRPVQAALGTAVLALGMATNVLYVPIKRDQNKIFTLSTWILIISLLITLQIVEQIFQSHDGLLGEVIKAAVFGVVVGGLGWAATRLLRSYREESTYPTLKDDWRSRKIIQENQEH